MAATPRSHRTNPTGTQIRYRSKWLFGYLVINLAATAATFAATSTERIEIAWPTPNKAFDEGKGIEAFVQPTQSGEIESGLFGCTRRSGHQFHEGLDIKPVQKDRRGEAQDEVLVAMDGVIRHINNRSGESSYGRYIVIEHPQTSPVVYTLYAHLARTLPGISIGMPVKRGQPIAIMGRSAGGYAIPKERTHLHFEIGLYATRNFQAWYQSRQFGSPNLHGIWNGMNLLGIDPLDFMRMWKAKQVDGFAAYFAKLEPVIKVQIASRRIPDFIQRNPVLLQKPMPMGLIGGWEIVFDGTGMPFGWAPLDPLQTSGMKNNELRIVSVDDSKLKKSRCKHLVENKRGRRVPGKDLDKILDQLFSLR